MDRHEFLKLPMEERRAILAQQARDLASQLAVDAERSRIVGLFDAVRANAEHNWALDVQGQYQHIIEGLRAPTGGKKK